MVGEWKDDVDGDDPDPDSVEVVTDASDPAGDPSEDPVDEPGCTDDGDCTDGNPCNGQETCNSTTHTCEDGAPPEDGFVCGDDPRSICLEGECRESECGDGFVDTGAGEGCEPPGEGSCADDCTLICESDLDCEDDGNICNGEEYCNLSVNRCEHRNPLADGTVCGTSPRRICLSETCQDSTCGDGYVDGGTSPPEECEDLNLIEGDGCDNDCTYSCHDSSECNDGHDCTDDTCDTVTTHACTHTTSGTSVLCRASAGDCDAEEHCNGVDADCPADGFLGTSTVCRPSADECDVAESCTGSSAACPINAFATSGTTCDDGDSCTESDQCDGAGNCTGTVVSGCCEITAIAAGGYHSCMLLGTGTMKCWGYNAYGQVGDGTTTSTPTPTDVVGLSTPVSAIGPGTTHSCAVVSGGGLECWGENDEGQLGDGTRTNRSSPVPVSGLSSGVSAVDGGVDHTCALMSTGGVKCWGHNNHGQLGNSSWTDSLTPVNVSGLSSGVTQVCAGTSHSCALLGSGSMRCWGQCNNAECGIGYSTSDRINPVTVVGLASTPVAIDCGNHFTCALLDTGRIQCWGRNDDGKLGDGSTTLRESPVYVSGISSGASDLCTSTRGHACAIVSGGMKCWGSNYQGKLGDGTTTDRHAPIDVTGLSSGVTQIACGGHHTCALMASGGMKCWGSNGSGQVGLGSTTTSELTPRDVLSPCP